MKLLASVRSRLLLGALLWTVGLFMAAISIITAVMLRFNSVARILHGTAEVHAFAFILVAALWLLAGLLLFRRGIAPLQRLRTRLAAVRAGADRRVEGRYPSEVQPLVDDLNALLDLREQAVSRALARAGDLAHGLKTPLAVLAQDADRAEAAGDRELAAAIRQQVVRMTRQIEYHLAQARAAASGAALGASCVVAESVDGLARTLLRLHAARGIAIDSRVPAAQAVRCGREDLDEMLGNLLDNACKWARTRVAVESAPAASDGAVVITVDDVGPGLAASMRETVLQRGVRADEAAPGWGLGLAIARDLAAIYGGALSLGESPLGGLRARLELPAAAQGAAARPRG